MTSTLDDARGELRKVCCAGGEVGCSCADRNYQWFDHACREQIVTAFKNMLNAQAARAAPVPQCDAALIAEEFYKTIPEEKGMLRGNAKGFGLMIAEAIRHGATPPSRSDAGSVAALRVIAEMNITPDTGAAVAMQMRRVASAALVSPPSEAGREDAWCQPMDCGKHTPRKFLLYFEDPDHGNAVFDNEAEARAAFERATVAWNCYLFGALTLSRPDQGTVAVSSAEGHTP
jgi:hypothetical protein